MKVISGDPHHKEEVQSNCYLHKDLAKEDELRVIDAFKEAVIKAWAYKECNVGSKRESSDKALWEAYFINDKVVHYVSVCRDHCSSNKEKKNYSVYYGLFEMGNHFTQISVHILFLNLAFIQKVGKKQKS